MAESTQKTAGLLSRWNQRREQVAAEQARETQEEAAPQAPIATEATVAVEPLQPTEPATESNNAECDDANRMLTAADLPNPDEIEIGGSFASFMGANVDPAAKSAALRALWKQPHFNEIDGLLEYALDYSNQPKLSAEVSAELAQKVFRYITKDSETPDEESALAKQAAETNPSASLDVSETTTQEVDTELAAEPIADNLDGETDDLPQNAPEPSAQAQTRVV
ncbi:hypothetical protein Sbal183_4044 [Shewanella baltica OS183]|uniref:DUF3306 domain-containing protein n=1 Tax=Shewanella baltica TaxID=62322 RepID=UPI0001E0B0FD|nr:DUF3306 domain-containing protein [Shewanella baltica]AEG09573.1 hypothetical protein Sbal175_0277 [Shewanella baltica BA175]EHQ16910.1 hypothetical protein Sbal183_4044 [Shewanella baltica OS183]